MNNQHPQPGQNDTAAVPEQPKPKHFRSKKDGRLVSLLRFEKVVRVEGNNVGEPTPGIMYQDQEGNVRHDTLDGFYSKFYEVDLPMARL